MPERRYLTTTLPYLNAEPHIGHASEFVQADILARYWRLLGHEVFFNTGTDEHGLKVYLKAFEIKEPVERYVERYAQNFIDLTFKLNITNTAFTRTTNLRHIAAAQEFWRRCDAAGDIYKKNYQAKYCVGCEMEKYDSELDDGHCPLHPTTPLEIIEEENYFFRFSRYQDALLQLYDQPDFVVPATRLKEIRTFVERGLQDFSISRQKSKMPWGIDVPNDSSHVMYVWFDALVNYISAIGWPDKPSEFEKWWPVIQLAGKDNLRQQSAMWQAMLLSAGLEPSRRVLIHGFITSAGQKMSKSVGNVIDPLAVIDRFGTDALRYFLARERTFFEDGDFTWEKFKAAYNGNLANGLGNLVSRLVKMYRAYDVPEPTADLRSASSWLADDFFADYREALDRYELNRAADFLWRQIQEADLYIQNTQPFKRYATDPAGAQADVSYLVGALWRIACGLEPFMPETAEKIRQAILTKNLPAPLFRRQD